MTPSDSVERAAMLLAEALAPARAMLVFTGAGVSTRSGIPDFRGPGGLWSRSRPVEFADFIASDESRREYWRNKCALHDSFADARPNPAHDALAELERMGSVRAVVTQNIDGLHQAAGSRVVIEIHGTNRVVECLGCDWVGEPRPLVDAFRADGVAPRCPCGGWLKFATISFGQPLRADVLQDAAAHAGACDLVLALGSTLSVHPAASIPLLAARRGVPYVIVNSGPTDHDALATLRCEGDVAEVLPRAVAVLRGASGTWRQQT